MSTSMKMKIRAVLLWLAHRLGSEIRDSRTGAPLGRALMVCWRGKVHFIGLNQAVVPYFLPQERLTYWKQELGFTQQPKPDFPHEPRS
jgi:hypothetical protein